jgi:hypothetical protein
MGFPGAGSSDPKLGAAWTLRVLAVPGGWPSGSSDQREKKRAPPQCSWQWHRGTPGCAGGRPGHPSQRYCFCEGLGPYLGTEGLDLHHIHTAAERGLEISHQPPREPGGGGSLDVDQQVEVAPLPSVAASAGEGWLPPRLFFRKIASTLALTHRVDRHGPSGYRLLRHSSYPPCLASARSSSAEGRLLPPVPRL